MDTDVKQSILKKFFYVAFFIQILIILSIAVIATVNISTNYYIVDNVFYFTNFYCIIVSTIILFGYLRQSTYSRAKIYFIILDIVLAFILAADTYSWIADGRIEYKNLAILCFTIYHFLNVVIDFLLWFFIEYTYNEDGIKKIKFECVLAYVLLLFGFLIPILNAFTGFGTYVDASGEVIDKSPQNIILHLPSLIFSVMIIRSIIRVKTSIYEKIILFSYIFVPISSYLLSIINYYSFNFYYPILFAVYIFIFCNLVVERERVSLQNEIVLAEKNNELNIANNIQKSMLPNNYEDYKKFGVDVFAFMEPAKEVGGDFYDYFMIDDNRFVIVIADVSEKGVPASLFMSIGKVLLKKSIMEELSLPKALNSVHKSIINSNKKGIFITLFAAIIDLNNNILTYTNAGHCLPLLKKNGEKFRYINEVHGTFIGCKIFKNIDYGESTIEFKKGDMLCLYTDGVTEAQNNKEELYGNDKLLKCVNDIDTNDTSKNIISHIIVDVKKFVGDCPQSDDMTLLCIHKH